MELLSIDCIGLFRLHIKYFSSETKNFVRYETFFEVIKWIQIGVKKRRLFVTPSIFRLSSNVDQKVFITENFQKFQKKPLVYISPQTKCFPNSFCKVILRLFLFGLSISQTIPICALVIPIQTIVNNIKYKFSPKFQPFRKS